MRNSGVPRAEPFWNHERTAAVVAVERPFGSLVLMLIRRADGGYDPIDISRVEARNLGKLGIDRSLSQFERFETKPTRWLQGTDRSLQVESQTQVWKVGDSLHLNPWLANQTELFVGASADDAANKLVPTRNGETSLLAAQRQRWA